MKNLYRSKAQHKGKIIATTTKKKNEIQNKFVCSLKDNEILSWEILLKVISFIICWDSENAQNVLDSFFFAQICLLRFPRMCGVEWGIKAKICKQ